MGLIIDCAYDLFDAAIIIQLVPLLNPSEEGSFGVVSSYLCSGVGKFFPGTEDFMSADLINSATFPHLVYSGIQNKILEEKTKELEGKLGSAKDLISHAIHVFPQALSEELPHRKSMKTAKVDHAAEQTMKRVIHDKWQCNTTNRGKLERIGIRVPDEYRSARLDSE